MKNGSEPQMTLSSNLGHQTLYIAVNGLISFLIFSACLCILWCCLWSINLKQFSTYTHKKWIWMMCICKFGSHCVLYYCSVIKYWEVGYQDAVTRLCDLTTWKFRYLIYSCSLLHLFRYKGQYHGIKYIEKYVNPHICNI